MNSEMSPKYRAQLTEKINRAIWDLSPSNKYKNVRTYINACYENIDRDFHIKEDHEGDINLFSTLDSMNDETLLKVAIDLSIDTPDFIPSIPTFRNLLKTDYKNARNTFEKAFKQVEENPDTAIGLANSTLEGMIKEILQDDRLEVKPNSKKTLYDLTKDALKAFQSYPNAARD